MAQRWIDRQPRRAAGERRAVLPARVRGHPPGRARGDHRDLHPVRGQGRPALHEALLRGGAARRAGRPDDRRLRLARPVARSSSRALAAAGVRVRVFDPGRAVPRPAAQPVSPHAPQDRGGRRRASPSSAASTSRPTTWPTSAPRPSRTMRSSSQGPIVAEIHRFVLHAHRAWAAKGAGWFRRRLRGGTRRRTTPPAGEAEAHVRHARQPATTPTTSSATTAPRSAARASAS